MLKNSKDTISSYQLSQKIGIRQSTCWSYAIRIKKGIERVKKKGTQQGWRTDIDLKLGFNHYNIDANCLILINDDKS